MAVKMDGCGILYVASGPKYLAEAEHSVRSVKRVSPGIPVAIVSDCKPKRNLFDMYFELTESSILLY